VQILIAFNAREMNVQGGSGAALLFSDLVCFWAVLPRWNPRQADEPPHPMEFGSKYLKRLRKRWWARQGLNL
jgi:hypothetical protein